MSDSRFPRIVGFEVPDLRKVADPVNPEPIVGLLDIVPSTDWVTFFEHQVQELTGRMGIARFSIEEDRLLFFGTIKNARQLCEDIRALVEQVSRQRHDRRTAGGTADANNLGESSFRRNS